MDEMRPAAERNDPTPPPPARRRSRLVRWIPLLLALGWLIPSLIVGMNLIQETPGTSVALEVTTPSLTASSEDVSYGGDAYTGIQNAAADTEHAVVDGVNELATFQLALQKAIAAQDAQRSANSQARVEDALGFLVIGLAVVNVTVALNRVVATV